MRLNWISLVLTVLVVLHLSAPTSSTARCATISEPVEFLTPEGGDIGQTLRADINRYQILVEQSLSYRGETLARYRKLKRNFEQKLPLSGSNLDFLNQSLLSYLELRKQFYEVAYAYECWLNEPSPRISEEEQLQGVMLSLSAALMLYDNYLIAMTVFEDDDKLRRYLNERHQGHNITRSQLTKVTLQYNSLLNRRHIRKGIQFFESTWDKQSKAFKQDQENSYLYLLITQSPSYNSTLKFSPFYVLNRYGKFFTGFTFDTLTKIKNDGVNIFSLILGNSVGLVQTRRGYLYHETNVQKDLDQQLRAGDILLEKTPFRLTDKLIPGYWGHVAIWVGTERELHELGIWNHPVVTAFHKDIREGKAIVEALRSGVTLSSMSQFLNVDDLAVLRHKRISKEERASALLRAFRQVGKPYDFNFDVETNDRIVCSELIYVAFTEIQWPTERTLGRFTISPTHIAEKADSGGPFEVVSLYWHGKRIRANRQEQFLKLF